MVLPQIPISEITFEKLLESREPCVLKQTMIGWKAVEHWPEGILDKCARDPVRMRRYQLDRASPVYTSTTWQGYLDLVRAGKTEGHEAHVAQEMLPRALHDDIGALPFGKVARKNLAVYAGGRTYAPLHYHPNAGSFSFQVVGHKSFLLVDPAQVESIPMNRRGNFSSADLSRLQFESTSEQAAALLPGVRFRKVALAPGDCLYIPPNWWHSVHGEAAFNLLLVAFFSVPLKYWGFPFPTLTLGFWNTFFHVGVRTVTRSLVRRPEARRPEARRPEAR